MITISSVEFQRNFGRYQDVALTEPVAITSGSWCCRWTNTNA